MRIQEIIKESAHENSATYSLSDKAGNGKVTIKSKVNSDGDTEFYSAEYVTKNNESKFKYEFKNNEKRWFDNINQYPKGELWVERTSQSEMLDKFMQQLTQEIINNYMNHSTKTKTMKESSPIQDQIMTEIKQEIRPILEQLTNLMQNTKEYKDQRRINQESK